MAVIPLTVFKAPFQGQPNPSGALTGVGVDLTTVSATTPSIVIVGTEYSFVNDGYTILYVLTNAAPAANITITSIRDNAGRVADIGAPTALVASTTFSYGPFRPIWWNQGGIVNVSFSAVPGNAALIAAVTYQF